MWYSLFRNIISHPWFKRIWKRAANRQDDHRQYIRQSLKHIFSLEYLLFVFWTVISYMGHVNFTVTFLQYTETITPNFSSYIDFYGNLTFMSAVIATFNALLVDGFVRKYSMERALQTKLIAFGVIAMISVVVSSVRTALQWPMDEQFVKPSTVLTFIGAPCLIGQQTVFTRCNYPTEFFGILSGFVRTMMSLASAL